MSWIFLIVAIAAILILAFNRASLSVWTIATAIFLGALSYCFYHHLITFAILWGIFVIIALLLHVRPLRRQLLSKPMLLFVRAQIPTLSATESAALAAGHIGWEAQIFTGMPDWNQFKAIRLAQLSKEEQQFMDNEVTQLCEMVTHKTWEILRDFQIPNPEIWDYIKKNRFLGLQIPKKYGGLEFSEYAFAQIVSKVGSISSAAAPLIQVPNSLGPAELILKYGLEKQKDYYLPRLARGEEIPCFGLTSPVAGSDAGAITDTGIICWHTFPEKQEKELAIRLNWSKRYITLAPIATLIGLAFKLYDPDHLVGDKESLGITCGLIPANTPGVCIGRFHVPLRSPFPNGPIQGHDVMVPLDAIIGGVAQAGQGWRMLVECLAAGRAISLPGAAQGTAQNIFYLTGLYTRMRHQFARPIGAFEGVQEALTEIGSKTFLTTALCSFTTSLITQHIDSAVASAISKYYTTEWGRQIINHAMDVHGGKGIIMGPRNYLAQHYIHLPIAITVEGANILTRSMMIFGQGAMRCHPYLLQEVQATSDTDTARGLAKFDAALFSHIGFFISNIIRSFVLGITGARFTLTPHSDLKKYYRQLTRYSAVFATVADMTLIIFGKKFKEKESISGRLADILSDLYILSAAIKYYESLDNGQLKKEARPFINRSAEYLLYRLQESIHDLLFNLPNRCVGYVLRKLIFPWGRPHPVSRDRWVHEITDLSLSPSAIRTHLSKDAYIKASTALEETIAAEPIEKKLHAAVRKKQIKSGTPEAILQAAQEANILTELEAQQLKHVWQLRMELIQVDDFSRQEFQQSDR